MIRRLFIVLGAGTIVFAGLGALSYARQIGYVGSWQSIGLRRGILTFVTRVTPINDSTGLFVDGASVVNRAMYYINKGARWWQISIWPIVLCIVAGAGYTLVLLPIRHRRRVRVPKRFIVALAAACTVLALLWVTSILTKSSLGTARAQIRLEDGSVKVVAVYRDSEFAGKRFPLANIDFGNYLTFVAGTFFLRVPLAIVTFFLALTTIVLAQVDRTIWLNNCHRCGYDLTGNESGVCPECGKGVQK